MKNTLRFFLDTTGTEPQLSIGQSIGEESIVFSVKDSAAVIAEIMTLSAMSDMGLCEKYVRTEVEVTYE
jgi:hypothetical protein